MPNTRSAVKRMRQALKRRQRNISIKSAMRTAIRHCEKAAAQAPEEAWRLFPLAQRAIDKAARKGVIHPNQAARRKSRLAARLRRSGSVRASATGAPGASAPEPAATPQSTGS